jgi:uncharacterized membrane protein YidH (DUF202 family)
VFEFLALIIFIVGMLTLEHAERNHLNRPRQNRGRLPLQAVPISHDRELAH